MAQQLPCDGEGVCMSCKIRVISVTEVIPCKTCDTPRHVSCFGFVQIVVDNNDNTVVSNDIPLSSSLGESSSRNNNELVSLICAIEADSTLNDQQKAKKRQQLMTEKISDDDDEHDKKKKMKTTGRNCVMDTLGKNLVCVICMQLLDRPVTTHFVCCYLLRTLCGHNFCLKCFEKWAREGEKNSMRNNHRINSALVVAIRMAKEVHEYVHNQNKPEKAHTTERAKRSGKANACSGKILATVSLDHFGPILADNDPERNQGVLVGESWEDRFEYRQWGVHFPHVAGIAGQSKHGSQSVVLSGRYDDDEDHGEWFLYTGSGGRDLSGNKRTNKDQSFDQEFKKSHEALRVSCQKGYPVRVVIKEKHSSYAPKTGLRYDGIYRIDKCWRKEEQSYWKWNKPPPSSKKPVWTGNPEDCKRARKEGKARNATVRDKILTEFKCNLCRQGMSFPITTPCAHNFCKHRLEAFFVGQSCVRKRSYLGRTLRAQKTIMKCPSCTTDLSEFLQNPQVNREPMDVFESFQNETEEENDEDLSGEMEESN
ncbi:hypothetical protein MKX01_012775 [Papaver californicum]|nr:hypothetical protein MKX01_012775 [Papaver californicum]